MERGGGGKDRLGWVGVVAYIDSFWISELYEIRFVGEEGMMMVIMNFALFFLRKREKERKRKEKI